MIKIAYIILAHKNLDQLAMLINQIKEDWCDIFLHVDEKTSFCPDDFLNKLQSPNIYFTKKRYSVDWGTFSSIDATFELLETVKSVSENTNQKYDRIIFLSGQDFPLACNNDIYRFFEQHKDKEFVSLNMVSKTSRMYRRINNIYIGSWLNSKNKLKVIFAKIVKNIPRPKLFKTQYYYGSQWFNITYNFLEYLTQLKENQSELIKMFKFSFAPDESMLHIFLMDSPYKDNLVNDNLRYIQWLPDKPNPTILKENDLENLLASGKLFARKFDTEEDKEILEKLIATISPKATNKIAE